MDFLNTNFTSINDFTSLDENISKLEASRSEIAKLVESRVNGGSNDSSEDVGAAEDSSGVIISKLEHICVSDASGLPGLVAEYGDLNLFNELSSLFKEREQTQQIIEFLNSAGVLEGKVQSLQVGGSNLEAYKEVFQEITSTAGAFGLEQVHTNLVNAFNAKVLETKEKLQSLFEGVLAEVKWLSGTSEALSGTAGVEATTIISPQQYSLIQSLFNSLIQFQSISQTPTYPETWWAIDTLINPFSIRFNYHFMTPNKKTNKISKPEWCFEYMEKFLNENLTILELTVGTNSLAKVSRIFKYEVITSLLVPVRQKMVHSVHQINNAISQDQDNANSSVSSEIGRFLSHLIFELSSFDQSLRSKYKYNPFIELAEENGVFHEWMGLTGDIMINNIDNSLALVASNWLNFESQLANKRFQNEILKSINAFEIDFDFKENNTTTTVKPTYSAYNLSKLFENLTSHFRTINIVKYQLKYVSNIQLELLDLYVDELTRQFKQIKLDSVLKFIPGSAKTQNLAEINEESLNNLTLLCQLYCSAKFMVEKMEFWSEELIFIQLWQTFKEISSASDSFAVDLTIFDDSIKTYKKLLSSISSKFDDFFIKQIRSLLKKYVNEAKWDDQEDEDELHVSSELGSVINILPGYLHLLSKSLSPVDFYVLSEHICSALSKTFREFVITNNKFLKTGLNQLQLDIEFVFKIFVREVERDMSTSHQDMNFQINENKDYIKVIQSIEVLNGVEINEVKIFGDYDTYPTLRERFESNLSGLNDFEIYDLLYRIK